MTSIDMSQYGRAGSSFKFDNIGDTFKGRITQIKEPHERENKFTGRSETVMAITVETESGDELAIWPRLQPWSSMGGAIADAVAQHGGRLEVGGTLAVQFTELVDVGKPQPAKNFAAQYRPPAQGVTLDAPAPKPALLDEF